jgi:hypothetical protein
MLAVVSFKCRGVAGDGLYCGVSGGTRADRSDCVEEGCACAVLLAGHVAAVNGEH